MTIGPSIHDVVAAAGGYVYDLASYGWDVLVINDDAVPSNALSVLGAVSVRLDSLFEGTPLCGLSPWSPAHVLATHPVVLQVAQRLAVGSLESVRIFQPAARHAPSTPNRQLSRHSSLAAQAFKGQALLAANGSPHDVTSMEALTITSLAPA